ncbi:hypothetical protein GRI58_07110 [Porphyrobacter algicida]|uniref:Uncharacterized protein n=1 Tax=Qipengyuania algicida TaxID=1836209 RepID=A0A845AGN5_9SPHN|nr:hypothetical protein [Qipengyuania algicida]MXP28589.1 hypothetical protein [Qipengyuania algicida]
MKANVRLVAFVLGALMTGAGAAISVASGTGAGIGLLVIGALVILSLAFERRYGRPDAPSDVPANAWERTRECFVDDETGQLLEVWVDPLTGERRYEPVQDCLICD